MKCCECENYFDKKLDVCPFCGAEVSDIIATKVRDECKNKTQKSKKRIITITVSALCVIIAVVLLLYTVFVPNANHKYMLKKIKSAKVGDYITFGTYEQDNDINNGKEDIEWLVLEVNDDKVLVISKYALDCKQYNTIYKDITWETSSLRHWLNGDFLNIAFTEKEKSMISMVTVTADPNPYHSTGNNTLDKVFCLSINEVENYFNSDDERQCRSTAYAVANGVYQDNNTKDYCWWWLRSQGNDQDNAATVDFSGNVDDEGEFVSCKFNAVRPAFWIELE